MRGAPRGFTNAWPAYAYEFEELIGQAEQREALEQTKREQNRVRLRPSYRQVIVCEMVISWPLYLTDRELRPTPVRDSLPRRTKATLIYRRTGNLRAVQLLLGTPRSKARPIPRLRSMKLSQ
jgi:hypothetical protein